MYRRLLVPLDGSCLAETILVVVERLAAAYRATVVLLHVIERGVPAAEAGVGLVVLATHGRAGVQAIWAGSEWTCVHRGRGGS